MLGFGREHRGLVSFSCYCLLCFYIVVNYFLMTVGWCLFVPFLHSLFLVLLISRRKLLALFNKTISKIKVVLIFNHSLGCLPYYIHHNETSSLSLSFELLDFLSLFIFVLGFKTANSTGRKVSFTDTENE